MDKFDIQKLRELPIVGVAERLGLSVKHRKCLCVHHDERNASMTFSAPRNTYRCWSCGAHGGTIDLTMQVLGKPFVEACEWLANEHNIILANDNSKVQEAPVAQRHFDASRYERYFERPWLSPEACKFLYDVRHLHPAVVRFCHLNSFRDWLQIPYYDQAGRLIGIQRRYMGTDPTQPRFRFQQGERCHLYNQQVIPMLGAEEPLYLAEGPSDTWALLSSGKKAVGIPSATLLKESDLEFLEGTSRVVHIYPDRDDAGEALYQKLLTAANEMGFCLVRHELPDGCKDFSDCWVRSRAFVEGVKALTRYP